MTRIKTFLLILLPFLSSGIAGAQTLKDASALFSKGQLDSSMMIAKKFIAPPNPDPDAYILIGRILIARENYEEAMDYLNKVQALADAPLYAKAWSMNELGICYFATGDYKKSKENINGCIGLNATKKATAAAKKSAISFGFDKLYESWITQETKHFIFHFQDTTILKNTEEFKLNKEAAFDSINSFFQSRLPKKIDYFVWRNVDTAEYLFKGHLAFTRTAFCVTHTTPSHTLGHEITHSLSKHSCTIKNYSQLISEGVAVYFDFSNYNRVEVLRKTLKRENLDLSIRDTWKNKVSSDEYVIYPLGGELVKRLIQKFGRDKFMQLFADQSFESAEKIYGDGLDSLINELEKELKN